MQEYTPPWKGEHLASSKAYDACKLLDGKPCPPCQQAIEFETQVEAARQALNKLLDKKNDLLMEINRYHDPVSRRLPPELTSKIFELYIGIVEEEMTKVDYFERSGAVRRKRESSILILGAVCRTWRYIAWSTPFLWNRLPIHPKSSIKETHSDEIEQWLKRSGDLPLNLSIDLSKVETKDPIINRLVSIINRHSHQWENLSVTCHSEQLEMFCGNSSGAPLLSKLCICVRGNMSDAKFGVSYVKPRPSSVELLGVSPKWLNINWNNLTNADLHNIPLRELIEPLQQALKLMKCNISHRPDLGEVLVGSIESVVSYQSIVHLRLQELSITNYSGAEIQFIFRGFSFPNLSFLELHHVKDSSLLWPSLISLLNRSSMPLKRLSLRIMDAAVQIQTLLPVLAIVPLPEELTLDSETPEDLQEPLAITFLWTHRDAFSLHFSPTLNALPSMPESLGIIRFGSSFRRYLVPGMKVIMAPTDRNSNMYRLLGPLSFVPMIKFATTRTFCNACSS